MLLFCPKCGKKMTEDMMACGFCGTPRMDESAVPPLFTPRPGSEKPAAARKEPAVKSSRSLFGGKAGDKPADEGGKPASKLSALFAGKGKPAAQKPVVAPAASKLSGLFARKDKADAGGEPPVATPSKLSGLFARKDAAPAEASAPAAGKRDLSALFRRNKETAPAVGNQRQSVLAASAAAPMLTEPVDRQGNPFQPMQVAAAGSADFTLGGDLEYAGFWRRFGAAVIDNVLSGVGIALLAFAVGLLFALLATSMGGDAESMGLLSSLLGFVLGVVLPWLYFALFEASSWQATPGKRLLGMRVTDLDGDRISFWRATGRYWGKLLSTLILLIGYLMQPFTARKQALHDKLAATLVVRG